MTGGEPRLGAHAHGPGGDTWHALMDSANDAYVAIDATGEVVEWNRRAEEIFGWPRTEAVGCPLADLIVPPELRDAHLRGLRRFVATGRGEVVFQRLELPAMRRDGVRLEVEFTILPARTPDEQWHFHAFLHDVTAERRQRGYLQLLERVAVAANEAESIESAVRSVLDELREVSGSRFAHAYLVDDDTADLRPTGWWSPAGDGPLQAATATTVFGIGEGLPGRVAESGRPAWIADLRRDDNFPRVDAALSSDVLAAFSFPVTSQRRTVAVIELFRERPSEPEEELLEVMGTVGTQLGRVFERQAALDDLRTLAEDREAIVAIVGHELQGPLAAAHTAAGLLGDELGDAELPNGTHLLDLLDRQLGRLRRLVDMFLTAQRLEAGSLRVRRQIVDVASLAEQVVSDGGFDGVVVDVPAGVRVVADPDHVSQMLWNLLGNAQRHGQAPIRLTVAERDDAVVMAVGDAGPGVPDEMRPELFGRFVRDAASHGSGLGLSIVRGLARANRGEATYVPGGPGQHSFQVHLPADRDV